MGLLGWSPRDMPDLTGKIAVVTGASSGIGFETCRALLDHGAEVVMVVRDPELGQQAARDLQEEYPGSIIHVKQANMIYLKEVKALADELLRMGLPIHILINMAGKFLDEPFEVTPEGFERTIALDYFGHVYLTLLLLDRIIASAPARIINMCSEAEAFGKLDMSDLTGVNIKDGGIRAYGRAKLMFLMFNHELQRRLKLTGKPVDAFAVHPGKQAVKRDLF